MTTEITRLTYGDMSLVTCSGANNYVYLIPAEELQDGMPHVFVWGNVGAGTPERAWHNRWFCLGSVNASAVPDSIEAVLRAHESEILEIAESYQGAEWGGNNHVGKWGCDDAEYSGVRAALKTVDTYCDASDWFSPVTLHEIVTDDSGIDAIVDREVDTADGTHLDSDDVRDWITSAASGWLDKHDDPSDDDDRDARLRARLIVILATA
jgi:hypothetical protein